MENLEKIDKWPKRIPEAIDVYEEDVFGFFSMPQKYNERGIRADRSKSLSPSRQRWRCDS